MDNPHPTPADNPPKIPEELIEKLHEADVRLNQSGDDFDAATTAAEPDHEVGMRAARAGLDAAERGVEEVTQKIHDVLDGEG